MEKFKIVTDTTADLPLEYLKEHNITVANIAYIVDGVTYTKDLQMEVSEFYQKMRDGIMPTTSQTNPEEAKQIMLEALQESKDVLCLIFSSGLSGTYNSFRMAREEVAEEYPDSNVVVVDTLAASMGEGLLVYKAVELREAGKSLQEVADWVENNKLHLVHSFTVDDLFHLYRGGRVSKTAAVIGSVINIKPVLHVDDEGRLIPLGKVRGRKKSLHALVDSMEEKMGSFKEENDIVFISHGDCEEDALLVKEEIEKRFDIHNFMINYIGPTIGAHAGPGTVALFFMGERR